MPDRSITPLPLLSVFNSGSMEEAAISVLRSGRIAAGEYVQQFEQGLEQALGVAHVVSTNDMTSALFLALHLAGVGQGDEVLANPFACLSTNAAIDHCGAVASWVDVRPGSVEMDVGRLRAQIGPRTKAVLLYHVAGYAADSAAIAAICREHGIALIEDCNNAMFAQRDGRLVGCVGDYAVYSFYPTRQINTAEGGALVCPDAATAARARRLRRFGIDGASFRTAQGEIDPTSDVKEIGWSLTMNNLCAALGCAQLSSASARVGLSRRNAALLASLLEGARGLTVVPVPAGSDPAYWVFLILAERRDALLGAVKARGVMASALHQRNDLYTGFGGGIVDLPHTSWLQAHILALPCGWWLSVQDIARVASVVREAAMESSQS